MVWVTKECMRKKQAIVVLLDHGVGVDRLLPELSCSRLTWQTCQDCSWRSDSLL